MTNTPRMALVPVEATEIIDIVIASFGLEKAE